MDAVAVGILLQCHAPAQKRPLYSTLCLETQQAPAYLLLIINYSSPRRSVGAKFKISGKVNILCVLSRNGVLEKSGPHPRSPGCALLSRGTPVSYRLMKKVIQGRGPGATAHSAKAKNLFLIQIS